jgi:mannose-6-phosphate isomerase-like protein (cupin superfamily)
MGTDSGTPWASQVQRERAMKYLLLMSSLVATAVLLTAAEEVTYVDHEKAAVALSKGGGLASGQDYRVSGARRTRAGQVEVHEKETDIFYVVDGQATFVTGGTMVGGKMTKAGQWLGTDIQGGETHHLTKGDVIVIPAGTPHWFKEVPESVNYYMVKVLKP